MTTPADVQKARLLLGWSVGDLAYSARVSFDSIEAGEAGSSRWSPLMKHRLLEALERGGIAFTLRGPELVKDGQRAGAVARMHKVGRPRRSR